jgi:hypothetical protein
MFLIPEINSPEEMTTIYKCYTQRTNQPPPLGGGWFRGGY